MGHEPPRTCRTTETGSTRSLSELKLTYNFGINCIDQRHSETKKHPFLTDLLWILM